MLCVADDLGLFSQNECITARCSCACCSLKESLKHFCSSCQYLCKVLRSKENKLLFYVLLELWFLRMNLAWDLKVCSLMKKKESSDGKTKKSGCFHPHRYKEEEEILAEDRNRRVYCYSYFHTWGKEKGASQNGESEISWSMGYVMSCSEGHLTSADQNLQNAEEWWTLA